MPIELPPLPYALDALAPTISQETLEFHYGKHHAGYVTKLNQLIAGTEDENKSLVDLLMTGKGGVFNCAAQTWNHTFYWHSLSPNGGGVPTGPIKDAIEAQWGNFGHFKEAFSAAAAGHFGSGWAWLIQNKEGKLEITQTHDAGCPLTDGVNPILTLDVWEHAYYIDYRNNRPKYIENFWNLVNWEFANQNLSKSNL
jgi:superoxide dismutase, Fe-Mn family